MTHKIINEQYKVVPIEPDLVQVNAGTDESSISAISRHRTKQGAENAIKEDRRKWLKEISDMNKEMGWSGENALKLHKWQQRTIIEPTLLD